MKALLNTRKMAACLGGLLICFSALAQPDAYYQSKGHWQLHTDAASHTTVVAFYDNRNRLVYQETLPGQHIRLSRKNIRRLDEIGARLTANQLVASAVQSDELLPAAAPSSSESAADWSRLSASNVDTAFGGFRTKVIPAVPDHMTVFYVQTDNAPVSIQLVHRTGQPVYQEVNRDAKYKRSFDLEQLEPGVYELILSTAQYRYSYRVQVRPPNSPTRPVVLSVLGAPIPQKMGSGPQPVLLQ